MAAVVLASSAALTSVDPGSSTLGTVSAEATRAVTLASSQLALIMNGTFEPEVTDTWIEQVMGSLTDPLLGVGYTGTAMDTPEQFWPLTGLTSLTFDRSIKSGYELLEARVAGDLADSPETPLSVFGYSQSAIIASVHKRDLAQQYASGGELPPVTYTMMGNPFVPNGGFLSRFPFAANIFAPSADLYSTPTDTGLTTYNVTYQYDMWADFPAYPLNLVSTVNALFGLMNHWYLSESVSPGLRRFIDPVSLDPSSPDYNPLTVVQAKGDTTYYLIPSTHLPMFYPLRWIGLGPIVDIIEPLARVFVELGYDRGTPYGEVVRARLVPGLGDFTADDVRRFVSDLKSALQQGGEALATLLDRPEPSAALPAPRRIALPDPVSRRSAAATTSPSPSPSPEVTVTPVANHAAEGPRNIPTAVVARPDPAVRSVRQSKTGRGFPVSGRPTQRTGDNPQSGRSRRW